LRVLLIGPDHDRGSIPPYLDVLAAGLRERGAAVERLSAGGLPLDRDATPPRFWPAERIVAAAKALVARIDPDAFDLVSLHYGNLEVEQLAPALWERRFGPRGSGRAPPVVAHVHFVDWTLFSTHVVDPALYRAVVNGIARMDGLVFFGGYARRALLDRDGLVGIPSLISYFPTTIPGSAPVDNENAPPFELARLTSGGPPREAAPDSDPGVLGSALADARRDHPGEGGGPPLATTYGFANPWKDPSDLLAAFGLMRERLRVLLAGHGWDRPERAGVDLRPALHPNRLRVGPAELTVLAGYITPGERLALVSASDFAVFPYRRHQSFQGSGAVTDYLAHGVPVVATDVANMAELIGDGGMVVPPGDLAALAGALDRVAGDAGLRAALTLAARRRAPRFSLARHLDDCLGFYRTVAGR
jgi:glycosyltransferase involved in cell wall biosynthesis